MYSKLTSTLRMLYALLYRAFFTMVVVPSLSRLSALLRRLYSAPSLLYGGLFRAQSSVVVYSLALYTKQNKLKLNHGRYSSCNTVVVWTHVLYHAAGVLTPVDCVL